MKQILPLTFRADATTRTGTGHIMRCLAIAEAWKAWGGESVFITYCESSTLLKRIKKELFKVIELPHPHPHSDDLAQTKKALSIKSTHLIKKPAWLVLDGYHFSTEFQKEIRNSGYRLLVIDDMAHLRKYKADILLNQNINACVSKYSLNSDTVALMGCKYALLRREFTDIHSPRQKTDCDKKHLNLMVSLGGSDPDNVTLTIIQAIKLLDRKTVSARIIIGPGNPHLQKLMSELSEKTCKDNINISHDPSMPATMAWADMTVSAGGTTCWELAYMGVPFLIITLADNQEESASGLDASGAAINMGRHQDTDRFKIANTIQMLMDSREKRKQLSSKGMKLIDGKGINRLFSVMQSLDPDDKTTPVLREANYSDATQLWRLANGMDIRRNSFSPSPIPLDTHMEWFRQKLSSPESVIYVFDLSGVIIGQARYDKKKSIANIDYSISLPFRGRGLGYRLINVTWELACRKLHIKKIQAIVKEDNIPSINSFLKSGWVKVDNKIINQNHCLTFEKKIF